MRLLPSTEKHLASARRVPSAPHVFEQPCSPSLHSVQAALDLDEAIVLNREALDRCLQGHRDPDRSMFLNNLAQDRQSI